MASTEVQMGTHRSNAMGIREIKLNTQAGGWTKLR